MPAPAPQDEKPAPAPRDEKLARRVEPKPAADEKNEITYSGRVLNPDDKPAVGAKVYLLITDARPGDVPKVQAVTDKEGRFSFSAPPREGQLFVTADGFAPAWVVKPGKLEEMPLRLVRDDVPVHGRILDLQGQPVVGATVRVHALKAPRDGTLDKWLNAVKVPRDRLPVEQEHLASFANAALPHFFPPTATDKEGRFEIKGLGPERVIGLTVEGPTIESESIDVMTRPGVSEVRLRRFAQLPRGDLVIYRPPTFDAIAAPCRVISGVVRDKESRKPVAGAVVRASEVIGNPVAFIQTTTDRDGKYRLTGVPRKPGLYGPRFYWKNTLVVLPPDGEPLLAVSQAIPEDEKAAPAVVDFDLPHGVWLQGQVKDKATGRGVRARLGYLVFVDGANDDEVRRLYIPPIFGMAHYTDREGNYRIVVAPYRGLIGARAEDEGREHYRAAVGADTIDGKQQNKDGSLAFRGHPLTLQANDFDTLVEIKPEKGAKSLTCDLLLDPGRTVVVQVRGPDGKPLAGVHAFGQFARGFWSDEPLPAEFTVYAVAPGEKRTLVLRHPEKNLTSRYQFKEDERGSIIVTLEPGATITGRLLGDNGRPMKQAQIMVYYRPAKDGPAYLLSRDARSDDDGTFRLDALPPGMIWSAYVLLPDEHPLRWPMFTELSIKSGATTKLGDVKPPKGKE